MAVEVAVYEAHIKELYTIIEKQQQQIKGQSELISEQNSVVSQINLMIYEHQETIRSQNQLIEEQNIKLMILKAPEH